MNETDPGLVALSRIATPDISLPGQLAEPPPDETAETRLFRWVLLSALADHLESLEPSRNPIIQKQRERIGRAARSWFAGEPGAMITFESCCAAFSMTPAEVRRRIAALTDRPHAPRQHWIALGYTIV